MARVSISMWGGSTAQIWRIGRFELHMYFMLSFLSQLSLLGRHCLGEGKRRQKRYLTEVGRVVGKLASGNCFIIHSPCCRCTMKQEDHHEHRAETGWDKVSIPPGTVMIAEGK